MMATRLGRGLALWAMIFPAVSLPLGLGGITEDTRFNQSLGAKIKMVSVRPQDVETTRSKLTPAKTFDYTEISQAYVLHHFELKPTVKHSRTEQERRVDGVSIGSAKLASDAALVITQTNQQSSVDSELAGTRAGPIQADIRTYETQRGDTLSKIARDRMLADSFSLQQKMIATLRKNPEVFVGNNINNLRIGKVLRLPNQAEIKLISREAARAEVTRQNSKWRKFRGKLSIGPSPQHAEAAELQKQVDLIRELAESRQQENEELSSRNKELKEIIAQQDRLITLQREEIANLQQRSTEQFAVESPGLPEEASVVTESTEPLKSTDANERQPPETGQDEASRGDTVTAITDFFAIAFILSGLVFFIAGSIGLLRLPDVYSRPAIVNVVNTY
jgi:pilus assembly protein FimV